MRLRLLTPTSVVPLRDKMGGKVPATNIVDLLGHGHISRDAKVKELITGVLYKPQTEK